MKDIISYDDFSKLDLRVGKVVAASLPDWSEKLVRYEVDFGEEIGKRVLFSGIRAWYKPEDLIGNNYPFVINLASKKMGPEESQGMMFMIDGGEKPILIELSDESEVGEIIR
jgi:methionyl-tRNA synthetase